MIILVCYLPWRLCLKQEFLVAVGVSGATLQHRVVPPGLGWYDQVNTSPSNLNINEIPPYLLEESLKSNICNFCLTDCWLSERLRWTRLGLCSSYIRHHPTFTLMELLFGLQVKKNISGSFILMNVCIWSWIFVCFGQTASPASQISGYGWNIQHLQQCLLRQFFLNTEVRSVCCFLLKIFFTIKRSKVYSDCKMCF